MVKSIIPKEGYDFLLNKVGSLLENARKLVSYQVNQILVKTYWEIGKEIVEFEQRGKEKAEYGSGLLKRISSDLTLRYGKGFSEDNLEKMRKFYRFFPNSETLSRKLSWSHYCSIMRLGDVLARDFYLIETEKSGWGVRELDRQINSMLFERIALNKNKKEIFDLSKRGQVIEKSEDLIKDPYILEFLGLEGKPSYSETKLESLLIDNLEQFMLELGKGFMFVARQQKITLENEHFYLDLVFYNRILRCFVIIELKLGKLTHKDLGQLQMYVNYYDRTIKLPEENNTVGILLCADKKEAIVKFTLPLENQQIFASQYQLYLPKREELEIKLKKILNTTKI